MEGEFADKGMSEKGFKDRCFVLMLWGLSLVAVASLAVLVLTTRKKTVDKNAVEEAHIRLQPSQINQHCVLLNYTMEGYHAEVSGCNLVEFRLKVMQQLEEAVTLSPFQVVRDSAKRMQEAYLMRFPMLKDRITKMNFQAGDIAVRHNNDFHSELFRKMSVGERKYSHLGVIERISPDSVIVYRSAASDLTGIGGITSSMIFDFMSGGDFDVAVYRLKTPKGK